MNSGTITNQLLDAVQVLVDDAVKKAEFDRTVQAVIVKCVSATKGKYSVKYQGGYFYAYAQDPDVTYSPDTQVYVLIPGNDMNTTKTILGTVDKLGEDFVSTEEASVYGYIGNNICSDDEEALYGLHSYLVTDNIVLYEDGEPSENSFNINVDAANLYLKNSDYLVIAAKFRTNLPQENRIKGNYGLRYILTFDDPLTGTEVDRNFTLDINSMIGNPYNQPVSTRQHAEFYIDSENFKKIKKIELFSNGFVTTSDDTKPADIFVSGLEMMGAVLLPADEGSGYVLNLITKQGVYFDENDSSSATRKIEAEIYKNKELQQVTAEDVAYYWFKANDAVFSGDVRWLKYGGNQWECINEYTTEEGTGRRIYKTNKSSIEISKQSTPAQENHFKCVVVYKDSFLTLEREVILYNKSSNYSVNLICSEEVLTAAATATLTCTVSGVATGHSLSYYWSQKLDDDIYFNELGTTNINTYDVNLKQPLQMVTYKCFVKDVTDNKDIGSATIFITRGEEEFFNSYYIVINNDMQVFKYDTDGNSPTSQTLLNPQTIMPLSFALYNPEGVEIPASEIGASNINWIYPTENTMLTNIQETGTYDEQLNFEIKNKYDPTAVDNTIKLEVSYDDKTIRAKANLIFLKEGENGSNGTAYYLKVEPNLSPNTTIKGKVYYYYKDNSHKGFNFTYPNGQFPFKTLFYRDGDLIYDSSSNNNEITPTVFYDFVKRTYTKINNNLIQDNCNFIIDENDIACVTNPAIGTSAGNYDADILRCTFQYDGLTWYYMYPIIFIKYNASNSANYEIIIPQESGFDEVVFTEDGRNPIYRGNNEFEIEVAKSGEKILTSEDWAIQGQIYTSNWQEEQNLLIKNESSGKKFYAKESYDGNCVTNAYYCVISEGADEIAKIHFPIAMYLNTYGNAYINEWNGNAIELNEEGGIILTPQIAAGQKENDNTFTGVVAGKAKESISSTFDEGIFGYNHGERTFELNAEDGSAKFGKTGAGQIVISPDETNQHSVLQSGNYVAPVIDASGNITQAGEGLQIDLTEPSIIFGSGKFRVDSDGSVHATEYALTANLEQGDYNIPSGAVKVDSTTSLADYVSSTDSTLEDLQDQIDGNISTWFYAYEPTLSNEPASTWTTTTEKDNHLGDLFYDTTTGYCYRFMKTGSTYSWGQLSDSDIAEALAAAQAAQDTADNKRRVFVTTPTPPYDIGDLWVEGSTGDIKKCKTAKTSSQSYNANDWEKASKYTDDTTINTLKPNLVTSTIVEYALGSSSSTAPTSGWNQVAPEWESGKYMWQRTTTIYADDTQQSPHRVTSDPTCLTGATGRGIASTQIRYVADNQGTTPPADSASWQNNPPEDTQGQYIWTRTRITYTDGQGTTTSYSVSYKGIDGQNGQDGTSITITSQNIKYGYNNSGTDYSTIPATRSTQNPGGWDTSIPNTPDGYYLWTRTIVNYSDNTSTTSYTVSYQSEDGTNATQYYTYIRYSQYSDGHNYVETPTSSTKYIGVSVTTSETVPAYNDNSWKWSLYASTQYYTYVRYASSAQPAAADISTDSTGKTYMGVAVTTATSAPTTYASYTWTKFVGDDGQPGAAGQNAYSYVRYSANADGHDMVDTPTALTKYVGIYAGTSSTVPAYTAFNWSKYIGEDGNDATQYYTYIRYSQYADGHDYVITPTANTKYVGLCVTTATTPPAYSSSDWKWSKYVGDDGQDATQYYTHVMYATSDQGANISSNPSGKTYIGIRVDEIETASTTPSDYTWSKFIGDDGTDGINGTDGFSLWMANVAPTNNIYTRSQLTGPSSTQAPRVGEIIIRQNRYQYNITAVSGNNITVNSTPVDLKGADGTNGTSIIWKGDLSSAPSNPQTLWAYYNTTDKKTYIYNGTAWEVMAVSGANGQNATQYYYHVVYCNNTTSGDGYSTSPSNQTYTGSYTDTTSADAADWATAQTKNIKWNYTKGATGAAGTDATNIICGNEAQTIMCTTEGKVAAATTITIPFAGYVGNNRAACSVVASDLPNGISVTSNTAATTSADGSLVLTAAANSTLGGNDTGVITLTFTCNSKTFVKKFAWSKVIPGAQGATGPTGTGIESITEQYYLSTSKDSPTGGSWVETAPTWQSGMYIWTRSKIVYKNPSSTVYTTALCSSEWEAINEIQIGGRNLALLTATSKTGTGTGGTNQCTTLYNFSNYALDKITLEELANGIDVVVSADWETTATSGEFRFQTNSPIWLNLGSITVSNENTSGHISKKINLRYTGTATSVFNGIQLRLDDLTGTVTVSNFKIEFGNMETTWSPAPEDTDTSITALNTYVDQVKDNLQGQIDGAIQFWNGANIPTLNNYPASDWTTEDMKIAHQADIYTVIQDVSGELKQGKSYRFDKVNNTWQWIELTDNELSAVQALASSKAKVFVTTPTVPYSIGDLWLKDGDLYRCKTAKDSSGSYALGDWELATNYTDDSAANAVQQNLDNLQIGARNLVLKSNVKKTSKNTITTYDISEYGITECVGKTVTISFDIKADTDNVQCDCYLRSSASSIISDTQYTITGVSTSYKRYTTIKDVSSTQAIPIKWFALRTTQGSTTATFTIKNVKVEIGNRTTDWSPAPEDAPKTLDVEYYLSDYLDSLSGGSWQTQAPTWVDGKYMWSRQKLTYGDGTVETKNQTCIAGAKGATGTAGTNTAMVYLYGRFATAPSSKPYSAAVTYTFSTGTLSSIPSGWSQTIPSGTNPLYVSTAIASSNTSTASIAANTWTTPTKFAQDGSNGTNGVSVVSIIPLYYLTISATTPAAPSTNHDNESTYPDPDIDVWTKFMPDYRTQDFYDLEKYTSTTEFPEVGEEGTIYQAGSNSYYIWDTEATPNAYTSVNTFYCYDKTTTKYYYKATGANPVEINQRYRYFTCEEVKYSNGNYTWTSVVENKELDSLFNQTEAMQSSIDVTNTVLNTAQNDIDELQRKNETQGTLNESFRSDIDNNFKKTIIEKYLIYQAVKYKYDPIKPMDEEHNKYDKNTSYYIETSSNVFSKINAINLGDYWIPSAGDGSERQIKDGVTLYLKSIPKSPKKPGEWDQDLQKYIQESDWNSSDNKPQWKDGIAIYACEVTKYGDQTKKYDKPYLLTDYQTIEDARSQEAAEVYAAMRGSNNIFYNTNGFFVYDKKTEDESTKRIVINQNGINFATRLRFKEASDPDIINYPDLYYVKENGLNIYYTIENAGKNYNDILKYESRNNNVIIYEKDETTSGTMGWDTTSAWGIQGNLNLNKIEVINLRAEEITDGVLTLGTTQADGKLLIQNDDSHQNFEISTQHLACPIFNNSTNPQGYIYIGQDIGIQCVDSQGKPTFGNLLIWTSLNVEEGVTYTNNTNYYWRQGDITSLLISNKDYIEGANIKEVYTNVQAFPATGILGTIYHSTQNGKDYLWKQDIETKAWSYAEQENNITNLYVCSCKSSIFDVINQRVIGDITFVNNNTNVIKTITLNFTTNGIAHQGLGFIKG